MTPMSMNDLEVMLRSGESARDAWPLDPAIVHLNHGSFGAVPRRVIARQDELRREGDLSPVGWFPRVPEHTAAARTRVAPFVGAAADDTVFTPNASAAATVVFNSLRLEPGDEILVTDHGYGAVTMGARRLARRHGANVRTVRIPLAAEADEVVEVFARELTAKTRLIVVDQITSSTARRFPTAAISDLAWARGVRVLVDGAHAPGLVAEPALHAGGDWWFGNLHKWPCAPRGAALLVTTAPDRESLWPLIDSWGADEAYPDRFDSQGTLDATAYLTAGDSIDFIENEYGWDRARATLNDLADAGAEIIGDAMQHRITADARPAAAMPVPGMRLVRLPDGLGSRREDADDLRMQMLDETGVEAAFTSFDGIGYLRLSAHLYTVTADFEAFVERCVPAIIRTADARRADDA